VLRKRVDVSPGKVLIGTSGWNYKHWGNGVFYPPEVKPVDWLNYYCQQFDTVEINYSFYRLPDKKSFEKWRRSVPPTFIFAVKGNRFITHIKRLKECEDTVPKFLSNASGLHKKLGPVLFQFPPSFHANEERLDRFLKYWNRQTIVPGGRVAFEFRHESWFNERTIEQLRAAGAAVCLADWGDLECGYRVTADFVYVRRHGSQNLYSGSYSDRELKKDAEHIQQWLADSKDVYVYFNNDAFGWAVKNAVTLREMVST